MNLLKFLNAPFTIEGFRNYIRLRISLFLKLVLAAGAVLAFIQGQYQAVLEILIILLVTFLPVFLGKRFGVRIPLTFETLAVVFVYMTLFLGEMQGYYERYWWWDKVLHTGSGFLLGIVGFLLVYVLNEKKEVQMELSPGFMSLFAFMFAMGIGALWEIFEFAMDQSFGLNMQKSGLVDTMWDLIVDAGGALIIAVIGWRHLSTPTRNSFLERWIDDFVDKNPRLFRERAVISKADISKEGLSRADDSKTDTSKK